MAGGVPDACERPADPGAVARTKRMLRIRVADKLEADAGAKSSRAVAAKRKRTKVKVRGRYATAAARAPYGRSPTAVTAP